MKELKNDLLTGKYTKVFHEENLEFNAPHHFTITKQVGEPNGPPKDYVLDTIDFQKGPIKEAGVNGVFNEDVIAMVICRLEHFQNSEFSCRENALALTKLEEALMWLRKRTTNRENRGVEGTNNK